MPRRRFPAWSSGRCASTRSPTIWARSPAFQAFRGTEWMPEPCRSCERREIDFGGCRCQALAIAGDAAATDPACALSPQPRADAGARRGGGGARTRRPSTAIATARTPLLRHSASLNARWRCAGCSRRTAPSDPAPMRRSAAPPAPAATPSAISRRASSRERRQVALLVIQRLRPGRRPPAVAGHDALRRELRAGGAGRTSQPVTLPSTTGT